MRTRDPTGSSTLSRPSADRIPLSSPMTSRDTSLPGSSTNERSNTMCAAIGVRINDSTSGVTIGPRAAKDYAVEPVGEATITPSAEKVVT